MALAIEQLMEEGLNKGVFPGAVLLFSKGDQVLHRAAYGCAVLEPLPRSVGPLHSVPRLVI